MRLATRGSPLARYQAELVAGRLKAVDPTLEVELVVVETMGDRRQDVPIHAIGGQGIFVKEVDFAVADGRADAAVHSAKDLPSSGVDDQSLVCVPDRADPRDALVGKGLAELGPGAAVGTGSVRRRAQLAWLRPDLVFRELRGNMATRLSRVPSGGAIVVAAAALDRLGWSDRVAELLPVSVMLPQVAQGAIAVTAGPSLPESTRSLLSSIEVDDVRRAVDAERAYLAAIGGGCDLPVGGHATVGSDGTINLDVMLCSPDGHVMIRERAAGSDPITVGQEAALRVLDGAGGRELLARLSGGA